MDDFHAAGVAFHEVSAILAGGGGPAAIDLEDHLLVGAVSEQFPMVGVIDFGKLTGVVVIAAGQAVRLELVGGLVEEVGQGLALVRLGEVAVAGNNQVFAADLLVELDGFVERFAAERAGADVGGRHLEVQLVEFRP